MNNAILVDQPDLEGVGNCVGQVNFTILNRFEDVRLLAIAIGAIAKLNFNDEASARIELALAEALNNVVEHAYAGVAEGAAEITVHYCLYADKSLLRVIDRGATMPPDCIARLCGPACEISEEDEPGWPPVEELPEGGFGLGLIRNCMSLVGYGASEGCNCLVMVKHFA